MTTVTQQLQEEWKTTQGGSQQEKFAFLVKVKEALSTEPPNTDKTILIALVAAITQNVMSNKTQPVFRLQSDIENLLRESHKTHLSIEDDGVTMAIQEQTTQLKLISDQMKNLSQSLAPSQSGKFEDSHVTPEQLNRIRDMRVKNLNVKWDDIVGSIPAKNMLKRTLVLPQTQKKYVSGIELPRGLLLFGPPGVGKTLLAKAAATELNGRFFEVVASNVLGSYVGETEKNIRAIFTVARRYDKDLKQELDLASPELKEIFNILFFDEIDGLAPSRSGPGLQDYTRRQINELIADMDGVGSVGAPIFYMGATNFPWLVDEAVLRRMGTKIYLPLPTPREVLELLQLKLGGRELKEKSDSPAGLKKKEVWDLLMSLKYNNTEYPLVLVHTAWFSNSDINDLADALLASSADYGVSRWWKLENGIYEVTDLPVTQPFPKNGITYVTITDIPKKFELPPPPIEEKHLRETLKRTKRGNPNLNDVYQCEWFAVRSAIRFVPPAPYPVPKGDDLFAALIYHMSLFGSGVQEDYAREFAFLVWRIVLMDPNFESDSRRWEALTQLFGNTPDSWPKTLDGVMNATGQGWINWGKALFVDLGPFDVAIKSLRKEIQNKY